MKRIHSFTVAKEQDVVKKETTENENGEKVTVEKTFVEKAPQYFFIRKPTRKLYDEAELFYAVKLSEGIKKGLLTKALLAKRYENDGGALSEPDIERFGEMYVEFYKEQTKFLELQEKEERTKEEQEEMDGLENYLKNTRSALTHFELEQQSLYEQTAEVRARNKTILWWVLHLAMTEGKDGEKPVEVFSGEDHDTKLAVYDELSELEDEYWDEVLQKFTYFVSFWFVGRVNDEKEFKKLLDAQMVDDDLQTIWKQQEEKAENEVKEETPVEEAPAEEAPAEEVSAEEPPVEEEVTEEGSHQEEKTEEDNN
tara:strand:+ start:10688 stop:11620 length:933 start_codon:yes stop_codon:yes gene_type:complete